MIFRCPNCSTRYSVDASQFGFEAQTVACARCGHQWLQQPVEDEPEERQRPSAPRRDYGAPPPPPPQAGGYPWPMPPYGAAPPPWPMPPYGAPQWPMPPYPGYPGAPQQPGMEAQPVQAPPPPPPPQPQAEPKPAPTPADFDPFAELTAALNPDPVEEEPEPEPMPEPEPEVAEQEESLSDDDLNRMLGPEEEPIVLESLTDSTDALDDDGSDLDLEDISDSEPIPEVFRSSSAYNERPSRGGSIVRLLLIILIPLLLLGGIGAGLFFGRDMIVQTMPFMGSVYEMIGISADYPGAGLEIKETKPEWAKEGDKDVLLVRGAVANVSDVPREVPKIRVVLYDSNNEEVQSAVTTPEKATLEPQEVMNFRVRMDNPSVLARRVEVMFMTEDTGREDEKKEGEGGHG